MWRSARLVCVDSSGGSVEGNGLPCSNSQVMHINVSRAYFHAKVQRLVLVRLPVEDRRCVVVGKFGLLRKNSVQLATRLASASREVGMSVRAQLKDFVWSRRAQSFRDGAW